MSYAIKIENLSKQYRLGLVGTGTLSHDIKRKWALMRGKEDPYLKIGENNDRSTKGNSEYVWALKDINFEIKQGEIVGIIGKNGAGKSTLLKILSKVTGPTTGKIHYKGRIGSLLEVGTGFHLELTGKENIYLNGAILGMRKSEITRKLDEIIDFSGVERYIDTPVKRYSSGMLVRLGFAVAAFLEPEILVVDEVLAVGDAEFQKKAIGKMQDVSKSDGRTVLFVSHNMGAIKKLCQKCIILKNGEVYINSSNVNHCVDEYLQAGKDKFNSQWKSKNKLYSKYINPLWFYSTLDGNINSDGIFRKNDNIKIHLELYIEEIEPALEIGIRIYNGNGTLVLISQHTDQNEDMWPKLSKGKNNLSLCIPKHLLNEGEYRVDLVCSLYEREWIFSPSDTEISINLRISGGLSESPYWYTKREGVIAPVFRWESTK